MKQDEVTIVDAKLIAEITHLGAQTARIQQQMRWQMPVYLISFIGALVAIFNLLPR